MNERYPGVIDQYYSLEDVDADDLFRFSVTLWNEPSPEIVTLYKIGKVKGCLKTGGEVDRDRAANLLLEHFRNGRLGRFSLERP